MIWHAFFQPFIEFGFMRRALVVCLALSLSTTMLGVFLLLRRMSLMGDALSHAILPGVAVGYLLSGMSLLAMTLGGFIAGIVVALVAGWVSRRTPLKEDASFAGFYLGSLALGVTLVSLRGSSTMYPPSSTTGPLWPLRSRRMVISDTPSREAASFRCSLSLRLSA